MSTTTSITADGTHQIARITRKRNVNEYLATIHIFGTFGGGTVTIQASPDAGTTKITQETSPGVPFSITAAASINYRGGSSNDDSYLYAVLTGATNPALTVIVDSNYSA